jgi:hypothetical protein
MPYIHNQLEKMSDELCLESLSEKWRADIRTYLSPECDTTKTHEPKQAKQKIIVLIEPKLSTNNFLSRLTLTLSLSIP